MCFMHVWFEASEGVQVPIATNVETAELHRKCDNSHQHIKIEGQYTKASAVYTDELAYALAVCISKGLRRKKACEAYNWTKDSGLEAVAFNDLLVSSKWATVDDWTWKAPAHINIHETASVLRLLKRQVVSSPKKRLAVGVDSHVGLSALAKGRSPSYGLRPVLRRACCCCLAGCLYPAYLCAPTLPTVLPGTWSFLALFPSASTGHALLSPCLP